MNTDLPLGSYVSDRVTGFTGVLVAKQTYLYGEPKYLVQPQLLKEDGGTQDAEWFQPERLDKIPMPTRPTFIEMDVQ